jgi:hypothetical protein
MLQSLLMKVVCSSDISADNGQALGLESVFMVMSHDN